MSQIDRESVVSWPGSGPLGFLYAVALLGAMVGAIAYGYDTDSAWKWAGFAILAYIGYTLLTKSRLPWSASPRIVIDGETIPLIDGRRGLMLIVDSALESIENTGILVRRREAEKFVRSIGWFMESGRHTDVIEKVDIRCAECGIKVSNAWLMQMLINQREPSVIPIFLGDLPGTVPEDDGTCPRCRSDTFAIVHKVR